MLWNGSALQAFIDLCKKGSIKIRSFRNGDELEPSGGAVFSDMKNSEPWREAMHEGGHPKDLSKKGKGSKDPRD